MQTPTPLDDVEFLARSPHRVAVLRTLATGPRSRPTLHEETGISQPTLGRVLGSLRDRNWVEQRGREFALTAFGELVTEEFEDLLDTVGTVQRLGEVVGLLPTDEMDFDLRAFADATVTTPTTGDAFRHVRRMEQLYYGADRVRSLVDTVAPGTPEDHRNRGAKFLAGDQYAEAVVTADLVDGLLADPEMAVVFREVLDSPNATLYRYEGTIPLVVALVDGTAVLTPVDEHGIPAALIETDDEAVRSWVEATMDEYRAGSTEVTVEDIPE